MLGLEKYLERLKAMRIFTFLCILFYLSGGLASEVYGDPSTRHPQLYRADDNNLTNETAFYCIGVEPNSWSIEFTGSSILFNRYDDDNKSTTVLKRVKPQIPPGFINDYAQVFQTTSEKDKQPYTLIIRRNNTGCATGLIELAYQFNGTLVGNGAVEVGCCNSITY